MSEYSILNVIEGGIYLGEYTATIFDWALTLLKEGEKKRK